MLYYHKIEVDALIVRCYAWKDTGITSAKIKFGLQAYDELVSPNPSPIIWENEVEITTTFESPYTCELDISGWTLEVGVGYEFFIYLEGTGVSGSVYMNRVSVYEAGNSMYLTSLVLSDTLAIEGTTIYMNLNGPNDTCVIYFYDGSATGAYISYDPTGNAFSISESIIVRSLSSDPSPPTAGQMYYNSTSNEMRYYNGSTWVAF